MPTIGWFEILIVVALAIIVLGPQDFPIMLKKAGSWIGTLKKYINNIQNEVSSIDIEDNDIEKKKQIIENFLQENKGKVLDIGCNTGEFLFLASKYSSESHGIDIDEDCNTSSIASGIVIKYLVISGCVIVIGPPFAI